MQIETRLERSDSSLGWNYFLPIDSDLASHFIVDESRRVVCDCGSNIRFHCALMPDGMGHFQLIINKERRMKLGWVEGQVVYVTLEKDTSEYGMPMCDELFEVFQQEQEGSAFFHALTPGKQRTLIHWTNNVKNPEIRIRRALVLVYHLINQRGEIDFKLLNQEVKQANQEANRRY